jgi:hypothetical protein
MVHGVGPGDQQQAKENGETWKIGALSSIPSRFEAPAMHWQSI